VSLDSMPADFGLLRFNTGALPASERLDLWRDVVTRKLLRLAIDPLSNRPFRAKAGLRAQHGVRMGVGHLGATVSHRTRAIVAEDNDDVALLVNLSGPLIVLRDGEESSLDIGDACLVDCGAPSAFVQRSAGKVLCVRMPRAMLADDVPGLESAIWEKIPASVDPLRLLVGYVTNLSRVGEVALLPQASQLVVRHIRDLAALSIGASRDAADMAVSRGLRAGRLMAVKAYVNANIGPFPLAAERVATHHGIGDRYLRKLFEDDGVSFTSYVRERRLARAHALLTDLRQSPPPVSAIAYDVGFGDLSYFNRAFRQRYGATPSEVRAESHGGVRQR